MSPTSSVLKTPPRDAVRKISYSTCCVCDIGCFGRTRIAEYESPAYYLFRNGRCVEMDKFRIPVRRDDMENTAMWLSQFQMEKEDRLIFFSDGISQSGMGTPSMPFGWDSGCREFIARCIAEQPSLSAKALARALVADLDENAACHLCDAPG